THPQEKSGWLRRNVVDRIRSAAGDVPVEHVVADMEREDGGQANVLVIANETIIGEPLLERIRERARRSPASFLLISPQSDVSQGAHPEAERRLRRALATLRGEGIEAHGQVAHPDPFTAAMQAVHDERVAAGTPWPTPPFHLPVFVAGVNTVILVTSSFTMHWALQSIKRDNHAGLKAGLLLTFLMGLTFLLTQIREYSRIGFAPKDGAFATIFYCLTGLHGAHVVAGLLLLAAVTIRAFRGYYSSRPH